MLIGQGNLPMMEFRDGQHLDGLGARRSPENFATKPLRIPFHQMALQSLLEQTRADLATVKFGRWGLTESRPKIV